MINDEDRRRVITPAVAATVLVDGFVGGTWTITSAGGTATLHVTPLGRLGADARAALEPEAERLLAFACPEVPEHLVRFG